MYIINKKLKMKLTDEIKNVSHELINYSFKQIH